MTLGLFKIMVAKALLDILIGHQVTELQTLSSIPGMRLSDEDDLGELMGRTIYLKPQNGTLSGI